MKNEDGFHIGLPESDVFKLAIVIYPKCYKNSNESCKVRTEKFINTKVNIGIEMCFFGSKYAKYLPTIVDGKI